MREVLLLIERRLVSLVS